ncbi:hypothetical protein [Paenibacillus sp. R14(2021)]|uniref:hypothetical protein n=1 Tax=Paenibacillus sp. R14(2021) TaxID=2859228 RepID=UPI001C612C9C|nr:hypothetical protein [Paenibacillus sp. R14(2021)]
MYLDKINRQWSAFMAAAGPFPFVQITNTTRIVPFDGAYMLEFERNGITYHFYSIPGEAHHELRVLEPAYPMTQLEAAFGMPSYEANAFREAIDHFMREHYFGIQTSVDGSLGLAYAKHYIYSVRLKRNRAGQY